MLTLLILPAVVIYFAIYVNNVTTGASVETTTTLQASPVHDPNGNQYKFTDILCFAANGCWVQNNNGQCTTYSSGEKLTGKDLEMAFSTDPINTFQVSFWLLHFR